MLLLTLPGVAFTYNGDEIGMLDHREISWDDTTDPWACNTNDPTDYSDLSRDPARTPFQWDASTNAGFNEGQKPWLPVHPNYATNNLELQTTADKSHYKFYKQLAALRKNEVFVDGDFVSKVFSEDVLGYSRSSVNEINETIVVLINFSDKSYIVNVTELTVKLEDESVIFAASSSSGYEVG